MLKYFMIVHSRVLFDIELSNANNIHEVCIGIHKSKSKEWCMHKSQIHQRHVQFL